jgi:hypothetical protein
VRSNALRQEAHAFYPALGYALAKTQRVYRKALGETAVPVRLTPALAMTTARCYVRDGMPGRQ